MRLRRSCSESALASSSSQPGWGNRAALNGACQSYSQGCRGRSPSPLKRGPLPPLQPSQQLQVAVAVKRLHHPGEGLLAVAGQPSQRPLHRLTLGLRHQRQQAILQPQAQHIEITAEAGAPRH
jgi:hypothetical protein